MKKKDAQWYQSDQLDLRITTRVVTFTKKISATELLCPRSSDCNCAVGRTNPGELRTRQQHLYSRFPKAVWYQLWTQKIWSAYKKKNRACLAVNILLLLHHESHYLGFILDTRLGRQARNHSCVPRQALARGTPDGAELLDGGWRRSVPGKQGGGAGCIQMHRVGTRTILEGNGAGIQTSLTSLLHDG